MLEVDVPAPGPGNNAVGFPDLAGHTLGSDLNLNFRAVPQPKLGGREVEQAYGKVV